MYDELLPGVGAFALQPNRDDSVFVDFLGQLMDHAALEKSDRAKLATVTATLHSTESS
jgi:hypothetical protein